MRRLLLRCFVLCFVLGTAIPARTFAQSPEDQIVRNARSVLDEIMAIPAQQIPAGLLSSARAIAIIPNMLKGGFVVGIRHGRGVMLIRDDAGAWQPPMFVSMTGGSVGWQAGIQSTDVILVFRSRTSVENLMRGKLTIGADASAAAGPVGRQAAAATDARLSAEILSYSRSRGLFAGVSIDGSVLQPDNAAGLAFYGGPVLDAAGDAIRPNAVIPESAAQLMQRLDNLTGGQAVMVTEAPRMAPAGVPNGPVAPAGEIEATRQALIGAWTQLAALLDDSWRSFLALPADVVTAQPEVNLDTLRRTVDHYALVSGDPRYAALAERPEFANVQRLLVELTNLYASQPPTRLTLPPPPPRLETSPLTP